MLALVVREEIVDAGVLHEPAHEVEVGLAVLNNVVQLSIGLPAEGVLEIGKPIISEDRLDDVDDTLVLEDPRQFEV